MQVKPLTGRNIYAGGATCVMHEQGRWMAPARAARRVPVRAAWRVSARAAP
jgi:hypothetical protein